MSSQWQEMLDAEGPTLTSQAPTVARLHDFVCADSVASLVDLSHLALYEVSGKDATSFLQGQFCNDISEVSPAQAQITGYCTPKGRLLALPVLIGIENGYRLLVPSDVSEAFIKRLSMFVLRSDVLIKKLDDWVAVGITARSEDLIEELQPSVGSLPVGQLEVSSENDCQLLRWHDDFSGAGKLPRARYLRIAPVQHQITLWQSTSAENRKYSSHAWRLADISAAIPSISVGVVEAFVPQMINLQHIKALSFTKGCYPGQEIVARMQYLGKLKRHMQTFSMPMLESFDTQLQPGAALSAGDDQNAGVIVDAMPAMKGKVLVLAVIKVSLADKEFNVDGLSLEPLDMPYALPSSEVA